MDVQQIACEAARALEHAAPQDILGRAMDAFGERFAITSSMGDGVLPLMTVGQQQAVHGSKMWRYDPDARCAMRKVEPLSRGLEPYVAYASGIRRDETEARAGGRR